MTTASVTLTLGVETAFSPLDVSGLAAWWAADEIVGLNDGDSITTWADLSGNGVNLTPTTNAPTYETGVQNSLPAVRFNGTDDNLQAANGTTLRGSSGFTFIAVLSATADGAVAAIATTSASVGSQYGYRLYLQTTNGVRQMRGGTSGNSSVWFVQSSDFGSEAVGVSTFTYDASTECTIRQAKVEIGNSTTSIGLHDAGTDKFTLGALTNMTGIYTGDMMEICIYEPDISDANVVLVENYLATKWGL